MDPQPLTNPHALASCWAIVVAAGSGARFAGDVPKQYLPLGNQRVLDWSLLAMRRWVGNRLILVVSADRLQDPEPLAAIVVCGGSTRSASVRAGINALPPDADYVLVHDGARPLVSDVVIGNIISALMSGADCVVPGVPVSDTVKRVHNGVVMETLNRAELVAVQTPQGFAAPILRRVHATDEEATDDAALVERAGGHTVVVTGDPLTRKVTTAEDLDWLATRVGQHSANGAP